MIFVDSSFWLALRLRLDAHHSAAVELVEQHGDDRLATTNHVRGETWTFLNRGVNHRSAVDFLDRLDRAQRLTIVQVTEEQEAQSLRWLRRHDERGYSFVDATSFAVMRTLRITRALAFDGDFSAAGFVELRP